MQLPKGIRRKLLLIDDETSIRDAVRLCLEDQDVVVFDIFESPDVAHGFEQARQILPDIIILDLHMPAQTGFDFMDLYAKDTTLKNSQVIMLTGDNTVDNMITAGEKRISPFRFIGKPFDINELQAIVFEACGIARK